MLRKSKQNKADFINRGCCVHGEQAWYTLEGETWEGKSRRMRINVGDNGEGCNINVVIAYEQRLANGPIDRSSDCIGRYNRLMSSSDFCIGRLCPSILCSESFIDWSCFLVLKLRFLHRRLCRSVLSSDSFINRSCFMVLSSDFCIVRLIRPVLSKKNRFTDTLFVDNLKSFSL